jgi:lysophospholipase L1-like esterase
VVWFSAGMARGPVLTGTKRAAFWAITVTSGLFVAFAILEAGSRIIEARVDRERIKPPENLVLMQANLAGTGSYRLLPNLDITTAVKGVTVHIRTNRHGMHWRDVEVQKLRRKKRIAFLGDSFTFGCWVERVESSFVGVVDQRFDARRYEVLNFGVGGYGLDDMELLYREQVDLFSPDVVVVNLFTGNDFRDTWLGIHKYTVANGVVTLDPAVLEERIPQRYRGLDGILSQPAEDRLWLRRSLKGLAAFRLVLPLLSWDNRDLDFRVSQSFRSFTFWSQYPWPEVALQARDELLLVLDRMDAFAREKKARLAVVAIPMKEQVYARAAVGPDFDLDYPQVFVKLHARQRGIPYLDLLPTLREHVRSTNEDIYVREDIHFNRAGHAFVGRLIGDWLSTFEAPVMPPSSGPDGKPSAPG